MINSYVEVRTQRQNISSENNKGQNKFSTNRRHCSFSTGRLLNLHKGETRENFSKQKQAKDCTTKLLADEEFEVLN